MDYSDYCAEANALEAERKRQDAEEAHGRAMTEEPIEPLSTITAGPYVVYPAETQVYFEHHTLGEDDACCVFVKGNIAYDYDMSFDIPNEARIWLDSNGYYTGDLL